MAVCRRVYDLALKKFPADAGLVLAYVDFLLLQQDHTNARALFERVLAKMPPEKASPVWARFIDFEARCGSLSSLLRVERRREETYSDDFSSYPTRHLVDRYHFMGLWPCSNTVRRALGYKSYAGTPVAAARAASQETPRGSRAGDDGGEGDGPDSGVTTAAQLPDLRGLSRYKPARAPPNYFPPQVRKTLARLPPPDCYGGPRVDVSMLLNCLRQCRLPEEAAVEDDRKRAVDDSADVPLGKRRRQDPGSGVHDV